MDKIEVEFEDPKHNNIFLSCKIKELEETIKELIIKQEYIKHVKHEYFKNVQKNKIHHCETCNKDIKYNSLCNHNKSKKHLENLKNI